MTEIINFETFDREAVNILSDFLKLHFEFAKTQIKNHNTKIKLTRELSQRFKIKDIAALKKIKPTVLAVVKKELVLCQRQTKIVQNILNRIKPFFAGKLLEQNFQQQVLGTLELVIKELHMYHAKINEQHIWLKRNPSIEMAEFIEQFKSRLKYSSGFLFNINQSASKIMKFIDFYDSNIIIEPMSKSTLNEAIVLTKQVFPEQGLEPAWMAFKASLGMKPYTYISRIRISFLKYWVVVQHRKVIGVTGIYLYNKDHDAVWGGWSAMNPAARGFGLGKAMFLRTIREARLLKRPYLRLYTSDSPTEAVANKIYDKYGCKPYKEEPIKGKPFKLIYRQMNLSMFDFIPMKAPAAADAKKHASN